eukprot:jgi/Botrbrau1/11075/Bobra.0302s0017.1
MPMRCTVLTVVDCFERSGIMSMVGQTLWLSLWVLQRWFFACITAIVEMSTFIPLGHGYGFNRPGNRPVLRRPQRDVLRIERDSTVGSVKVNLECLKKVLNKGCALQPLIAPPVEVAHVLGGHIADLYGEAARSMTAAQLLAEQSSFVKLGVYGDGGGGLGNPAEAPD